jgi:hypothetical protein
LIRGESCTIGRQAVVAPSTGDHKVYFVLEDSFVENDRIQLLATASSVAERLLCWTRSLGAEDPSERDLEQDFWRLLRQLQAQAAAVRAARKTEP